MPKIKLNDNIVKNIRNDYFINGMNRKEISTIYSISVWTVSEITTNKIWKISGEENIYYNKQLEILKKKLRSIIPSNKVCTKCGINKDILFYNKQIDNDRYIYSSQCKDCISEYKKEYAKINKDKLKQKRKEYYQENTEILINRSKKHYQENKEQKKEYDKNRRAADPEKFRQQSGQYYYDNKEDCIERGRKLKNKKYKESIFFKLRNRLSCEINRALHKNGSSKNGHSILEYLPYSIEELKEYLEARFESWMNWDNWGTYDSVSWDNNDSSAWAWQLDHIIPQGDLPYISMLSENFNKCWALENLRPLSAKQNILDGVRRTRHKNGR
jgi:hypothetical protein